MAEPVRIVILGGLGEIGRNCLAIEQGTDVDRSILVIDCGIMFPSADLHGIDLVLPDFTYLRENASSIVGLVATHGHEDHVGGIQFLLRDEHGIGDRRDTPLPVFGSRLTLGLARNRIEEAGLLGRVDFVPTNDGDRVSIGPFEVEFVPVTHSVPHAHAIVVRTEQGVILHSGDYKLDLTPVDDRRCDLARLGRLRSRRNPLAARRFNERRGGWLCPERDVRRQRAPPGLRRARRQAHYHCEFRKSLTSHPADCRCSHRRRSKSCDARSQHAKERSSDETLVSSQFPTRHLLT